jgi:dTDP-4-dehydrorhamnose reductase
LSVTDHTATARLVAESDVVFFAAAYTHVDGCETDSAKAFAVNRDAPAAAAREAARRRTPFVVYSTEYVFDGTAEPYAEGDVTRPLSVYGRSKLEGEQAVLSAHPDALVLRTSVVYGIDHQEKNFVYQTLRHGRSGERMKVPNDQRSNPTYVEDLAAASIALVGKRQHGILHVAGPEVMDRGRFTRTICDVFGLDPGFVESVSTAALAQTTPRPLGAGLSVERARSLGITVRSPVAGLTAMREALMIPRG